MSKYLDTPTPSANALAKKFKMKLSDIRNKIKQGAKVEKEHTSKESVAKEISRDHLRERPDYYARLKKVEGKG